MSANCVEILDSRGSRSDYGNPRSRASVRRTALVTANRASWIVVYERGAEEADKPVKVGCYAEILASRCRHGYNEPPRSRSVSLSGSGVLP